MLTLKTFIKSFFVSVSLLGILILIQAERSSLRHDLRMEIIKTRELEDTVLQLSTAVHDLKHPRIDNSTDNSVDIPNALSKDNIGHETDKLEEPYYSQALELLSKEPFGAKEQREDGQFLAKHLKIYHKPKLVTPDE
jgi:hypothetical protein